MAKKKKETKINAPVKSPLKKERSNLFPALLCAAVIAVVTWFVFSPSLQNDFTNWDDPTYVTDNPLVVSTVVPIKEIFKTPVSLNYHPLTILTLAWNYQSGKLNPVGYHLENVILHVLNTLLVFFFIFLLTRRNILMASFVALFFGIHPMHVESVSWVSERKDVLYVFFFLGGLITYLQYKQNRNVLWYIAALLLFIFSCLSKGMAVVFPVILLLIDYLQNVKWKSNVFIEKIPFFAIATAIGIVAFKIQAGGAITDMKEFTLFQRLMFASYGAIMYIVKLFLPLALSAFYPYPTADPNGNISLIFYLSPFILLALAILVYVVLRKEKIVVFGLLFYLTSVVLVLQFISVGTVILADRYSYLSYIGLLFIMAYLVNKAWEAKSGILHSLKYPVVAIVALAALVFSYQTYARTQIWKNGETLWADVIEKIKGSYMEYIAFDNRAQYYHSVQQNDKAIIDYNRCLKLNPKYSTAYNNRGNIYRDRGQYDSAFMNYNNAISFDSTKEEFYTNRAICYSVLKQGNKALIDFSKSLSLNPNYSYAYFNRGLFYVQQDRPQYDLAIADFNRSLQLRPNDDRVYSSLGLSFYLTGKYDEAVTNFSSAIQINAGVPDYWANRSYAENSLGRKEEAKADAIKAGQLGLQMDPAYQHELGIN